MARVIYTDDLFQFMDEHNFHVVGRERLESFAKDMGLSDQYRLGYCDAIHECVRQLERILKEVSNGTTTCQNCDWYAPTENVCCNEDSDYGMRYMFPTERCERWALSKDIRKGNEDDT